MSEESLGPLNPDETSLAVRFLQARVRGTWACSLTAALACLPAEYSAKDEKYLQTVATLDEDNQNKFEASFPGGGWCLLMENYELYHGHSNYGLEQNQLLWADASLTRFFMLNRYKPATCPCCQASLPVDFKLALELAAQRVVNLITYLSPATSSPKWLRATFISTASRKVPPKFYSVDSGTIPTPTGVDPLACPPILHLKTKSTPPVLSEHDLLSLDCLFRRAGLPLPSLQIRKKVLNFGEPRLMPESFSSDHDTVKNVFLERDCAVCGKSRSMDDLSRCSACRMAFFCDRDCQRKAWKEHKKVCMPREG